MQLETLCDHGMVQADRGKLKSDLEVRDQGVKGGTNSLPHRSQKTIKNRIKKKTIKYV